MNRLTVIIGVVILTLFVKVNIAFDQSFNNIVIEPDPSMLISYEVHKHIGIILIYKNPDGSTISFAHPVVLRESINPIEKSGDSIILNTITVKTYRITLGPASMYKTQLSAEWKSLVRKTYNKYCNYDFIKLKCKDKK